MSFTDIKRSTDNNNIGVNAKKMKLDIDAKDKGGRTQLHMAVEYSDLEHVTFLIEKGADINAKDNEGMTPLYTASFEGELEIATFLIEKGADLEAKNDEGMTALHIASRGGELEIVKILIDKGADLDAKDEDGCIPLHRVFESGNVATLDKLMRSGSYVNYMDDFGRTPINLAVKSGVEMTKALLNYEPDTEPDYYGDEPIENPLHMATRNCDLEMMELLLEYSADIEDTNWDDETPLEAAARRGNLEPVKLLVKRLKRGSDGIKNAIYSAAKAGQSEIANFLEKCIDSEDTDTLREMLHLACWDNELGIVKFCLGRGANIDLVDKKNEYEHGNKALHIAVKCGHFEIVKLLIESGANIRAENARGKSAMDISRDMKISTFMKEYEKATAIQYFVRVTMSKFLANKLRMDPENLFGSEFSTMRKRMLKIDDSHFK